MYIKWRKKDNIVYILIFLSINAVIQMVLLYYYQFKYPILSFPVLILVPLGLMLTLTGSIIILCDFLYQLLIRIHEDKRLKGIKKVSKEPSLLLISIISVSIIGVFYIGLSIIFNFLIIDPILFSTIPVYGQFTLSQCLVALIILLSITILKELQNAKKIF